MSRIVLALGGNALGSTPESQLNTVHNTANSIADIVQAGNDIIIVHGNGPQVGMINLGMSIASSVDEKIPYMPYPECGAMSQGYIGYHLQQAIGDTLIRRGIKRAVSTVITQVTVDENDPAFKHPTKPVGRFYSEEEAKALQAETGDFFIEDAGRGWRRVIASPMPSEIVELETIKLISEAGDIVITAGGGGIPITIKDGIKRGVAAVIDKDRTAALLASKIDADMLMILTAVDKVCLDYNTPECRGISSMSANEAKAYINEGHFAPGSMLPKVEACISYLENTPKGKAVIASLDTAGEALLGNSGTVITN